jgi:hypothetical protein
MRKYLSRALLALIVIGLAIVAWSAITIIWQEPVTAIQHHRQEAKLEKQLAKAEKAQEHRPSVRRPVLPHLPEGTPVGHLKGRTINALVVMGAAHDDLIKGPGLSHHVRGSLPQDQRSATQRRAHAQDALWDVPVQSPS